MVQHGDQLWNRAWITQRAQGKDARLGCGRRRMWFSGERRLDDGLERFNRPAIRGQEVVIEAVCGRCAEQAILLIRSAEQAADHLNEVRMAW